MSRIDVPLSRAGFGQTQRADNWWVQPLVVFLGFSAFIVYSTWAALQGQHFRFGPYLSPFYSPELFGSCGLVWCKAKLDACLGDRSDAHPVGAGRLSIDVLLLSRRILQGFLGRSAFLHGGRASEEISRRTIVSFDPAKLSPIFSLSGPRVSRDSGAGRVECVLVRRPVWHRRRHPGPVDEPHAADLLHAGMPFLSSSGWRFSRPVGGGAGAQASLRLRELPESAPHAVCLVQSLHGSIFRFVCAYVLDGYLDGLENRLVAEYIAHEHDVLIIGPGARVCGRPSRPRLPV